MRQLFRKLRKDRSGATAVEYGLIAGLFSIMIITAVQVVGSDLTDIFTFFAEVLDTVPDHGGGGATPPAS